MQFRQCYSVVYFLSENLITPDFPPKLPIILSFRTFFYLSLSLEVRRIKSHTKFKAMKFLLTFLKISSTVQAMN